MLKITKKYIKMQKRLKYSSQYVTMIAIKASYDAIQGVYSFSLASQAKYDVKGKR